MKRNFCLFFLISIISLSISCQSSSQESLNSGKIDVVGSNWIIKFPASASSSNSPRNIEIRFLKETNHPTISKEVTPDATSMELSNVAGFPPSGKIYTFNGETIGYTSISGNTLQGLERSQDGTISVSHKEGQSVYLIALQREIGDKIEYETPQLPDSYYIHYSWQTGLKDNGNNGWSGFEVVGFAQGSE